MKKIRPFLLSLVTLLLLCSHAMAQNTCALSCSECQSGISCVSCAVCSFSKDESTLTLSKDNASKRDYTTNLLSMQEVNALNLLNMDRNFYGLENLEVDGTLSALARLKSEDMRDNKKLSHTSPKYGKVKDMLKTFEYPFTYASENIAHHRDVEKAQAAFISSPDHRGNCLTQSYKKVGIGVANDAQGFVYVTQIFAK